MASSAIGWDSTRTTRTIISGVVDGTADPGQFPVEFSRPGNYVFRSSGPNKLVSSRQRVGYHEKLKASSLK
jgi:hypothetical protein